MQKTPWTPPGFDHTHRLLSGKFHRLNNITHRKKDDEKDYQNGPPLLVINGATWGPYQWPYKSMGLQASDRTWRPVPARGLLGALLFDGFLDVFLFPLLFLLAEPDMNGVEFLV